MGTTELLVRLDAARRRLDLRRGLTGAAWSALAGAVLVALMKLASLAGLLPGATIGTALRGAGAVFAIGLGVTALWVWRTRPTLLGMARRADRSFELHERLSTVLELDEGLPEADRALPVVAALFRDAAAHTHRVDPRRLVPIEVPRPAVVFAVVAAGVLVLQLAFPGARSRQPGADLLAAVANADPETSSELILDIAELLREQAERDPNEYLRVVATSLEQLASDVVEEARGGQPLADELSQLLEHAEAASNVTESDAESDGFSLTLASIEQFLQEQGQGELVARADDDTREGGSAAEAEASPLTPRELFAAAMDRARAAINPNRRERVVEETDAQPQLHEFTAPDSTSSDGGPPLEEMDSAPGVPAPPVETTVSQGRPNANIDLGGGSPVDEEAPGGAFPTPLPGAGAAAVMAPERIEVPEVPSSRDFELPMDGGSRRRLPEEIVPQTRFTEVAESALPRGAWQQTAQDQVTTGYLGVSFRDVASRYFLARIRQAEVEAVPPTP